MVSTTDKAILSFANVEQLKAVSAAISKETGAPLNKVINAFAKLEGLNQKSFKEKISTQNNQHIIPIELTDVEDRNASIQGRVAISSQGVGIGFTGYETATEYDYDALPVWTEYRNNEPCVNVWADKAIQDPTHEASLANAKTDLAELPDVSYTGCDYHIDGVVIPQEVWDEEHTDVSIEDREQRISDIEGWIGEIQNDPSNQRRQSDLPLMREDLDTLKASSSEFVLGWYGTSGFIIPEEDRGLFIEKCKELVQGAKDLAENNA